MNGIPKSKEYQKYEFCRDMKCSYLIDEACCLEPAPSCRYTAKEFHHWLQDNRFLIVKVDDHR